MPRFLQDVDEEPDGGRARAPQSAYEERYWDTSLQGRHKVCLDCHLHLRDERTLMVFGKKITQGQALEEYFLSHKDLKGLDFERKEYVLRLTGSAIQGLLSQHI